MFKKLECSTAGLAALLLACSGQVHAKLGSDQSANGVANWKAGLLPGKGHYLIVNSGYYGGKLYDGQGGRVSDTRLGVWYSAFRYVRMTGHQWLGADYGWQLIVPVVHQDLRLGGQSGRRTDLADITFNPLILSWHRERLHWVLGLDINMPTGHYNARDSRRSPGVNYWALEPLAAVTWLPGNGWEASAKFMYNIKDKNRNYRATAATPKQSYHSGQEFHVDYLLGRQLGRWGVGVAGYYLKQTTSDRVDGHTVPATPAWSKGRRGQVLAYGPSVSYRTGKGSSVSLQWNHESRVRNRFGGDRLSLKLVTRL